MLREEQFFLDEVAELSLRLQARLLDFLQSRTICSVGGNQEHKLNVRVIVATHKNLNLMVEYGAFREDLFHRLRIITLFLKPLRERLTELDFYISLFLKELSQSSLKVEPFRIDPLVLEDLKTYHWPGNFRELRNLLEYAVMAVETHEKVIQREHLPSWFLMDLLQSREQKPSFEPKKLFLGPSHLTPPTAWTSVVQTEGSSVFSQSTHPPFNPSLSSLSDGPLAKTSLGILEIPLTFNYHDTSTYFEKEYFTRILKQNGGRISYSAKQIGLNKTTFIRRLKAYKLHPV